MKILFKFIDWYMKQLAFFMFASSVCLLFLIIENTNLIGKMIGLGILLITLLFSFINYVFVKKYEICIKDTIIGKNKRFLESTYNSKALFYFFYTCDREHLKMAQQLLDEVKMIKNY